MTRYFACAAKATLALMLSLSAASAGDERTLSVGGIARHYLLWLPKQGGPRPTILVLHGGRLSAANARRTTGFEEMFEREGFALVYPDAVDHHWNDGRAVALGREAADDAAFVRALVAELIQHGVADPARAYVTGPSNGGMMTLRLVCEAAELFAAAAPIIASLPAELAETCKPARAVPVLIMNGTADPLVPYAGGEVGRFTRGGSVLSTDATLALLRKFNGCAGAPEEQTLADLDPDDGSDVTIEQWTHCTSGAPVVLYRIDGAGHRIPHRTGRWTPILDRLLGRENRDFSGAEAIWEFFRDKRR
jgi:polyhydroxybutyrate depolymerase